MKTPSPDTLGARHSPLNKVVADRIRERLSLDGELPRLSVSVGIAICPEDGETTKELLNSADAGLYAEKTLLREGPNIKD